MIDKFEKKEKENQIKVPRITTKPDDPRYDHPMKTTMDVSEAADYLKTTKDGLYNRIQRREIPYIRVGKRRIIFFREDLEAFLDSRAVSPSQEIDLSGRRGK
mgnify:CR=1 FL=1